MQSANFSGLKTTLVGPVLFVEEDENQDFKMAMLKSLGYDDKKIKEIRFIDRDDKTDDGSRNQIINGIKVVKKAKIEIMTPMKELMNKVQFNTFQEHEEDGDVFSMTMHVDKQLALILSCIFGGKKPSEIRLIDFKSGSFSFQGYTTFARRNKISQKAQLGFIEIILAEKMTKKPEDYFRVINDTFLFKKRKNMFTFLSSCLEFAPDIDDFADPFDDDYSDSSNFDTFKCNSRMMPFPANGSFNVCSLEVPFPIATFLLEGAAENLSLREDGSVNKITQPTIYLLSLPQRIPALFQNSNGTVKISFANFMKYSADYAKSRVQFVINRISKPGLMFNIRMGPLVAENYSLKDIREYAIDNNLICVTEPLDQTLTDFKEETKKIYKDRIQPEDAKHGYPKSKVNTLTTYLLITAQTKANITKQQELFSAMFDEIYKKAALFDCISCNYTSNYKNPCPIGDHSGVRIPFKNSKGEEVEEEITPTGQHRVCYSCCGIVISEFDPGCTLSTNHTVPEDEDFDEGYETYTQRSEITPLNSN